MAASLSRGAEVQGAFHVSCGPEEGASFVLPWVPAVERRGAGS
jgi:hypothetical protein